MCITQGAALIVLSFLLVAQGHFLRTNETGVNDMATLQWTGPFQLDGTRYGTLHPDAVVAASSCHEAFLTVWSSSSGVYALRTSAGNDLNGTDVIKLLDESPYESIDPSSRIPCGTGPSPCTRHLALDTDESTQTSLLALLRLDGNGDPHLLVFNYDWERSSWSGANEPLSLASGATTDVYSDVVAVSDNHGAWMVGIARNGDVVTSLSIDNGASWSPGSTILGQSVERLALAADGVLGWAMVYRRTRQDLECNITAAVWVAPNTWRTEFEGFMTICSNDRNPIKLYHDANKLQLAEGAPHRIFVKSSRQAPGVIYRRSLTGWFYYGSLVGGAAVRSIVNTTWVTVSGETDVRVGEGTDKLLSQSTVETTEDLGELFDVAVTATGHAIAVYAKSTSRIMGVYAAPTEVLKETLNNKNALNKAKASICGSKLPPTPPHEPRDLVVLCNTTDDCDITSINVYIGEKTSPVILNSSITVVNATVVVRSSKVTIIGNLTLTKTSLIEIENVENPITVSGCLNASGGLHLGKNVTETLSSGEELELFTYSCYGELNFQQEKLDNDLLACSNLEYRESSVVLIVRGCDPENKLSLPMIIIIATVSFLAVLAAVISLTILRKKLFPYRDRAYNIGAT